MMSNHRQVSFELSAIRDPLSQVGLVFSVNWGKLLAAS